MYQWIIWAFKHTALFIYHVFEQELHPVSCGKLQVLTYSP